MKKIEKEVRQDWEEFVEGSRKGLLGLLAEVAKDRGEQTMTLLEWWKMQYRSQGEIKLLPSKEDKVNIIPDLDRKADQLPDYSALLDFGKEYSQEKYRPLISLLLQFHDENPKLFESVLQKHIIKSTRRCMVKALDAFLHAVPSHVKTLRKLAKNSIELFPSKINDSLKLAIDNFDFSIVYAKAMRAYLKELESPDITKRKTTRKNFTSLRVWEDLIDDVYNFFRKFDNDTYSISTNYETLPARISQRTGLDLSQY